MNIREYDEVRPGISLGKNEGSETELSLGTGERKESFAKIPEVSSPEKPEAEKRAETAIADLHDRYAEQLRQQYDYSMGKLREERDNALRENWILQQQAKAALPEQLAAAGINGGASETTLAEIDADYMKGRNEIRSDYAEGIADASAEHYKNFAENSRNYNDKWIEYLLSLAKMEEEYKKKAELQ